MQNEIFFRANGMKLECIERFIEFEQDPSKGTEWLLERVDEYLEQAKVYREQLDRAEKYLRHLREQFPKSVLAEKTHKHTRAANTKEDTRETKPQDEVIKVF